MKKLFLPIIFLLLCSLYSCNYNKTDITNQTNHEAPNTQAEISAETDEPEVNADSKYSTDEIAEMLMLPDTFTSVLKNETKIYAWDEYVYLKDFIDSQIYSSCVLSIDFDGNGMNDVVVLEVNDVIIVLKESEGTVYAWQFRVSALYYLRIDGTYDWSSNDADGFSYGSSRLQFEGAELVPIELDRVVENERFYVNGLEVSYEEYEAYIQNRSLAELAVRYNWKPDFEISEE